MTMPKIDLTVTSLTGRDLEIALGCLNKGALRASKPISDGESKYVWRHVAFSVSPNAKHQCMPMSADFDLPEQYWDREVENYHEKRRARIKELDLIVDAMVKAVPPSQWYGVSRWRRALGATG